MIEKEQEEKTVEVNDNVTVIKTDTTAKDGQNKCPKCGSTEISTNINKGVLRCDFCRYEFEPKILTEMQNDIKALEGEIIGSGAQNIQQDAENIITLKCTSCGSEVVIDTASQNQARCHWCRNVLSINQQIPNGAIPDVVLPFNYSKDVAKNEIAKFVNKRRFFAHPQFVKEFNVENVMGVYFPYMLIDINAHSSFKGQGEEETRSYYVESDRTRYYDAKLYDVYREFDIAINGLSVESSSDKLNKHSKEKTNNIINSIMPFDTENAVKYDSNYLKGYTSEKRDTDIEQLKPLVSKQAKDIARFAANSTATKYDRGIRWDEEKVDVKGQQWKSAYLPVWIYSYQEVKNDKKLLHYVAVNGRTKEIMGSVPIHMPKLLFVSFLVELLGVLAVIFTDFDYNYIFLAVGFIYFFIIYSKYRNSGARHHHETETKKEITNLVQENKYIKDKTKMTSSSMEGSNNHKVEG